MTVPAETSPALGSAAPIHACVIPLGAGLLLAALATDIAYVRTVSTQWETFSVWLITGGLVMAAVSGVALICDLLIGRTRRVDAFKFLVLSCVVAVSVVNAFVHSRDGYTAVVPTGISLSACAALLLIVAAWDGWSLNARSAPRR